MGRYEVRLTHEERDLLMGLLEKVEHRKLKSYRNWNDKQAARQLRLRLRLAEPVTTPERPPCKD